MSNPLDLTLGLKLKNNREKLRGLEAGLFNETKKVCGIQLGGINYTSSKLTGVQIGAINITEEEAYGVQIGAIQLGNFTGSQIGLINVHEKSAGLQLGLANSSFDPKHNNKYHGVQVGAINDNSGLTEGVQVGLWNSSKKLEGAQFGIICCAGKGHYAQFGLITIRTDENLPWYKKFSPFFGFRNTPKPAEQPPTENKK